MAMELLGARNTALLLRAGRRRPLVPPAPRRHRPDPALDRHRRRLPALDLRPPGQTRRPAIRRLDRHPRPLRRHRRLVRLRRRPRQLLASPAPHLPVPVLLHRIRHRPARRAPGLAQVARPTAPRPSPTTAAASPSAARARCPPSSKPPAFSFDFTEANPQPPHGHHPRGTRPC